MSTTVPPADDMSITVAPAGVVLVYKPRSMKKLFVRAVCGERSSPAWWWCECSLKCHSGGWWERGWVTELTGEEVEAGWRRDMSCHMMSPQLSVYEWVVTHVTSHPNSQKPPPPVYLRFGFRCHFSCCPDWSTSSCCGATSCGSTCWCGNHPRLCSHVGSRGCLLQCTIHHSSADIYIPYLLFLTVDGFCCFMTNWS